MKKIILTFAVIATLFTGCALLVPAGPASAAGPLDAACASSSTSELCKSKSSGQTVESVMGVVVNTLLYIVGAISVIMVIFAGIMYAISSGDSTRVTKAKNMLTYAIVGLVVSLIAFALVNWVFNLFK